MARPRLALLAYGPGDVDRFTPREDFIAERDAVAWQWPDGPPPGRTWTLVSYSCCPSEVLGVGGLFDDGAGVWEAWAILSNLSPREWVEAGKLAQRALEAVERFNAPREICATARTAIPGAALVLEKLGFEARGEVADPRLGGVVYQHMVKVA